MLRAGMSAYAELQSAEFGREKDGYKATAHQKFVGTGYFDLMSQVSNAIVHVGQHVHGAWVKGRLRGSVIATACMQT